MSEKQEKFVNISYRRTLKLSDFVSDLLKITRMRLNNIIEKEYFSLSQLVNNVIEVTGQEAKKKLITIEKNLDPDAMGYANKFSIEEVVYNLIINAVKYTPVNGKVKVCVKIMEGYSEITVEDNGIGIPENEINNVFDDFYRASNARSNKIEGSGLGLSLVWQIIERNNGKIWVESELGRGSKFNFSLPNSEMFEKE
jgi:signal transduction histidine kinase